MGTVEEWHGGKVHKIRPSVIHLMRGQIFDIDGGILELDDQEFKVKKKRLDQGWRPYRINHLSWWKEEMPSVEEMVIGHENLERYDWTVDFIVTHCCASSTQALLSQGMYKRDALTNYFEELRQSMWYKKWFFGHYHDNKNVTDKEILLYEQIIRIS